MHTKPFIVLLLFLVTKSVWLFYAYQIDGLNGPAQQTLGWKCISWDDKTMKCNPGKKGRSGWTIQLTNFLGGTDRNDALMVDSKGNTLPLTATNPDPEETAKRVLNHYLESPRGSLPDYQGFKFVLHGDEFYVRNIRKIANVVAKSGSEGKNIGDHKVLFEGFATATTQIKNARIGDHSPFILKGAEERLNPRGITVHTESIGPGHSPADPKRIWKTVDWEKTMSEAVASGKFTKGQIMQVTADVRYEYYKDFDARRHRAVIKAFSASERKAKGCL
ncbi:hypothetical protein F4808DRAFT_453918 [Astrocystis sublimbata]|nr:hypothetical protein F4808DRAFT_453918 [Astrocystis sublimbata]